MARLKPRKPRPYEIVMDEAPGETAPWDLDEHLNGCLVAYQIKPSYSAAVFFALEALWGIARDAGHFCKGVKRTSLTRLTKVR